MHSRTDPDRQTDAHTHAHTHTHTYKHKRRQRDVTDAGAPGPNQNRIEWNAAANQTKSKQTKAQSKSIQFESTQIKSTQSESIESSARGVTRRTGELPAARPLPDAQLEAPVLGRRHCASGVPSRSAPVRSFRARVPALGLSGIEPDRRVQADSTGPRSTRSAHSAPASRARTDRRSRSSGCSAAATPRTRSSSRWVGAVAKRGVP